MLSHEESERASDDSAETIAHKTFVTVLYRESQSHIITGFSEEL